MKDIILENDFIKVIKDFDAELNASIEILPLCDTILKKGANLDEIIEDIKIEIENNQYVHNDLKYNRYKISSICSNRHYFSPVLNDRTIKYDNIELSKCFYSHLLNGYISKALLLLLDKDKNIRKIDKIIESLENIRGFNFKQSEQLVLMKLFLSQKKTINYLPFKAYSLAYNVPFNIGFNYMKSIHKNVKKNLIVNKWDNLVLFDVSAKKFIK